MPRLLDFFLVTVETEFGEAFCFVYIYQTQLHMSVNIIATKSITG